MTRRTRQNSNPEGSAVKSKRSKIFSVNNPFNKFKRRNYGANTPKLKSYSATATPAKDLKRSVKKSPRVKLVISAPQRDGQPRKVKKAPESCGKKTKRRGFGESTTPKSRKTACRSESPALKGLVPLTPKTLVSKNKSVYLDPPIVVEDETLITIDETGEVLDLTHDEKPKKLNYSLSEGEVLTDDEVEVLEVKRPFTRSNQVRPDQKRFPTMGLRASSRSKMPEVKESAGLSNVVIGSSGCRRTGLRPVVIDGQNVAIGHSISIGRGNSRFSSRGIDIMVEYFKCRGHEVTVFVPQFRTKAGQADDRHLLEKLEKQGVLSFTPSRTINGLHINSYDDRYVVQYAAVTGGIIVSNDNYKDLRGENPQVTEAILTRVLKFTWVKDTLMFPPDPMGKYGPSLDKFLRF